MILKSCVCICAKDDVNAQMQGRPCRCVCVCRGTLANTRLCLRVPLGPVCPLLAASWLYSAWLVIKPFHGGNFHTTVNRVRWLKAAQFVVQSHCYSSSLIFFRPLKWELRTAGFSHWNKTGYIPCPTRSVSPLSCQQIFHRHESNLITA